MAICGRCKKDLKSANKHNAFYIRNPNDERTFGLLEYDEFILIDENGYQEKDTFKNLQIKLDKKIDKILSDITSINEEMAEKELTEVEISMKTAKKDLKQSDLHKIRIISETKTKQIPKTLIVCKKCKQDDDKVIW